MARAKDKPSGSVFLRYYHADHLGSPVAQSRPDGAVTWRETCTPYGEEWSRSKMWDDRPGYTGHVKDEDTGLTAPAPFSGAVHPTVDHVLSVLPP